jgi:hypothetical protein
MAKSKSNLQYGTSLNVSLVPSGPPGYSRKWLLSITADGFPDSKVITIIKQDDQQLIDLDDIIEEFIQFKFNDDYKSEVATLLESLAIKIRKSIENNS